MKISGVLLTALFAVAALWIWDSPRPQNAKRGIAAEPETCPKTLSQWDEKLLELAKDLVPFSIRYTKKLDRTPKLQEQLSFLKRCKEEWAKRRNSKSTAKLNACTKRIENFIKAAQNFSPWKKDGKEGPSRSLGFNVPDPEYYRDVDKYVSIPSELVDQKFLQAISHPLKDDGVKTALAFIEDLNTKRREQKQEEIVAFYFPTKLGNLESWQTNGNWRLFLKWPGNPVKYIQFATSAQHGGSGQTSVVAVRTDEEGTLHTYIKDHWREIPREGPVTLKHVTEGVFKGNSCIVCHQSGPRKLDPDYYGNKLDESTEAKIKTINREFARLKGMRWGGGVLRCEFQSPRTQAGRTGQRP